MEFSESNSGRIVWYAATIWLALFAYLGTAIAQPVVHLEGLSDQKTFIVKVDWMPENIGKENVFNVTFYDSDTGTMIEDVRYDFTVSMADGQSIVARTDVYGSTQTAEFPKAGGYTIKITNIEDLGEGVSIPIQFSPEFPSGSIVLSTVMIVGLVSFRLAKIYLDQLLK